jgi:hypothetical protein
MVIKLGDAGICVDTVSSHKLPLYLEASASISLNLKLEVVRAVDMDHRVTGF